MSKRHQASRRRSYGRRQHELHERDDRHPELLRWPEAPGPAERGKRFVRLGFDPFGPRLALGAGD